MAERRCKICQHDQRAGIDAALVLGRPLRAICVEFAIPRSSLHRHSKHVQGAAAKALERVTAAYSRDLRSYMRRAQEAVLQILESAKAEGDRELALRAAAEVRANTECMRKLLARTAEPKSSQKRNPTSPDIVVEYEGDARVA